MSDRKKGHNQYGTARLIAFHRAECTEHPVLRQVCFDPFAKYFAQQLGQDMADKFKTSGGLPDLREWVAGRTAFFDATVREAIAQRQIRQVVMMGAGYDTRCVRLGLSNQVKFFEVDSPGAQQDKLKIISTIPSYPKESATYVSCDFETQDFLSQLEKNGFRKEEPALFVIEGVIMYLTEAAVRDTFTKISKRCHSASVLAFDYFSKTSVFGGATTTKKAQADLAKSQEPMLFGLNHALPFLYECGFRWVVHHDMDELVVACTGEHKRERMHKFQSVCIAAVDPSLAAGIGAFQKMARVPHQSKL